MDVGSRLRHVREKFGLSQRELAKRAGVTNGTISLIEQNRVSPSVSSLMKVLEGLPMTLAEFFTFDLAPQAPTPFYPKACQPNVGREQISFFLVGLNHPNRNLTLLREIFSPGANTGPDMLSHDGQEGGVIVRGSIELTVNGETQRLEAGDGYYFDSRLPHRFANPSNEPCELISANTPPSV